jgi:hypothetical protein
VGIEVAQQQHALEEQHRGGPNTGRTAEPRQHGLAQHGLDEEQQKRTEENGANVQQAANHRFALIAHLHAALQQVVLRRAD